MKRHADIDTEVLIIGTGPAGGSAAALLATYGIDCIVVNRFPGTSRTPRAHITNQRALEILRDLGLEPEVQAQAVPNELMGENPFCTSLAGEELGRIRTWGTEPDRRADYERASPTMICDLPQNLLEPILVRAAAHRGAKVRFLTEYLGHEQDGDGVTTRLKDHLNGTEYTIRSNYLIGADGANSKVVSDLGLPIEGHMGVSGSMNIVFDADLSRYAAHRPSVLYWIIHPGAQIGGLGVGVVRMVRPWHKWLAIWGYEIEDGPPELSDDEAKAILYEMVGDDSIPIRIEATSTWTVNDAYARQLSSGRVFCMGDAVHRHSPFNGLGSNVSIQDAYNLAWKLAHVLRGKAAPALLDSYDTERAPVAEQTVKRANSSLELMPPIFQALGLLDTTDPAEMRRNMDMLKQSSPEAAEQRENLRRAIDESDYVYNCHGVETNQRYASAAILSDGTTEPPSDRDFELFHHPSSRPGAHVPHAWLTRDGHRLSTLDLCGQGRFSLLTGLGGEAWQDAAQAVRERLGIELVVHIIGPGREHEDCYGDFARLRGTEETGALLVRPDMYVGWRAQAVSKSATEDLLAAMTRILAWDAKRGAAESAETPGAHADAIAQ